MKRGLLVITIMLLLLGVFGCKKKVEEFHEEYVAYIKINPSFKISYITTCTKDKEGKKTCVDPTVTKVEAVNDDAKEIVNGVDFTAETKDLSEVISKICGVVASKGIDVSDVKVESDWEDLGTYIENTTQKTAPEENTQSGEENSDSQPVEYGFSVSVATEEQISSNITTDVQVEAEEKAEAERKAQEEAAKKAAEEAEKKAKEEAAAKEKAAKTIYLKDNVKYNVGGRGYCCEGCLTDSLIRTIKNAKGYKVTSSSHDRIDFMYITSLSSPYNETKYKGSNMISKLTAAGAEECGGLGGGDSEPLTKSICKEYNLLCE